MKRRGDPVSGTMSETFRAQIDEYLADVRARQAAVWPAEVPREVTYPFAEETLTDYLRNWAKARPDHPVIKFHGTSMTYAELDELSDRVAAYLAHRGLQRGDRVAVMLPNVPQFIVVFFGILKSGCVHVPVNPMFKRLEINHELVDSSARLAFVLDDYAEEFIAAREGTALESVVAMSVRDALPGDLPLPRGAKDGVPPFPDAER